MVVHSNRSNPDAAKDRLTAAYMKDVKRFPTLPIPDLINEGNIGLIKAARRFDIAKEFRFISYAVWWIRQGILHALSNQPGFLSVSTGRMNDTLSLRKIEAALTQKLGRHPRMEELQAETKYSSKIIRRLYREESGAASAMGREGGGSESREFLELRDETQNSDEAAERYLATKEVEGVLGRLGKREREILKLHYGLETDAPLNMAQIAGRVGLSRERVRQIKNKALAKLRSAAIAIRSHAMVRSCQTDKRTFLISAAGRGFPSRGVSKS